MKEYKHLENKPEKIGFIDIFGAAGLAMAIIICV